MNLLLVTTSLPHRRRHGAETATMNLVEAIRAAGHRCDVVGHVRPGEGADLPENFISAGEWPIEVENAGLAAYGWMLKALACNRAFIATKFRSPAYIALLRDLAKRNRYDAVIINHAHMGWVLEEDLLPRRRIFVAHNVEWRLYAAMGEGGEVRNPLKRWIYRREGRMVAALERRLARSSDQVWVLTEADAKGFDALGATGKTRVFGLPGQAFPALDAPVSPQVGIGILGNWAWDVNRRGLDWFMAEIVPRLPSDIAIEIAGNRADLVPNPHANVRYRGFVEDAGAFLRNCRVLAVPTLVGGGVQIKTIEGISAGMPMVATPLGLRGIADAPGFVRVARDAEGFAGLLAALARDSGPIDTTQGSAWAARRRARFDAQVAEAVEAMQARPHLLEPAA